MSKVSDAATTPGGDPMHVDTGQFAALTQRVETLAAEVAHLRNDAIAIRTLEQMLVREAYGYSPIPGSADTPRVRRVILEEMRAAGPQAPHLRLISDGT